MKVVTVMILIMMIKKCALLPCRLLENEIQQLQKETALKEKEFCQQIEQLKKDNSRQQKLIVQVCRVVLRCLVFLIHVWKFSEHVMSRFLGLLLL